MRCRQGHLAHHAALGVLFPEWDRSLSPSPCYRGGQILRGRLELRAVIPGGGGFGLMIHSEAGVEAYREKIHRKASGG